MISSTDSINDKYPVTDNSTSKYKKELGQKEFMKLMMAQLKHQDPMKPMDNGEFLGQMAQFSTVTGIEGMQKAIEKLSTTYAATQTLQSSQLLGREVMIESNTLELSDQGDTNGSFELDARSNNVLLDIYNSQGTLVRQIPLGELSQGRHSFSWNGTDDKGKSLPEGAYKAQVTAQYGDEFMAATVLTNRIVESVEFGSSGETRINTLQGDVLSLADVRQIRQDISTTTLEKE